MNHETAERINSAACTAWFFQQGILARLRREDVQLLQSVTAAQIQSASEVVEALNRDALATSGRRTIACTLDPEAAIRLKAYADSLRP